MVTSCTSSVCPTGDGYLRRAVKLVLLGDSDSTSNPRPASSRRKNSALTLEGSRTPYSGEYTRFCGNTIFGGPSAAGMNSMVVPSAVTAEYWYSINGSQLSPLRTDTDPSGWTWNSLPRLKNGIRSKKSRSSPGTSNTKQRIGVGLFEFGVVGRDDQRGDPALDEDADVGEHVADRRAPCRHVVDRGHGASDPSEGEDGAEKSQAPTRSG